LWGIDLLPQNPVGDAVAFREKPTASPTESGLQKLTIGLYSMFRSEFYNYAVGPWVSVAGREAALARGNPVKELQI